MLFRHIQLIRVYLQVTHGWQSILFHGHIFLFGTEQVKIDEESQTNYPILWVSTKLFTACDFYETRYTFR